MSRPYRLFVDGRDLQDDQPSLVVACGEAKALASARPGVICKVERCTPPRRRRSR